MRIVLFCENKYAIDILYPIYQEALKSEDNQLLWYIHLPKIPVFPLQKEVTYTHSIQEVYDFSDEDIQKALFNAGAIGYLAMRNATVAGACGGCQAETGVAAAMAASAAVELMGGTPKECTYAASTVLMNMLGLVCDPVGGLVEYPCQNRNAAGVANAIIAAEMALAGIPQLIPLDEMIHTMFTVGKKLPAELRETAMGGCATTPSACEACHMCS